MKQVRIFLYFYSKDNGWSVRVFRDLASLKADLEKEGAGFDLAVIHIGFDRPDSDTFDQFLATRQYRVLATASARYAMPKRYRFSSRPIGFIADELPVFMALNGWGYECNDDSCPGEDWTSSSERPPLELSGWIKDLKHEFPELVQRAVFSGIYDDATYIQFENKLNREDRIDLAKQRIIRLSPDHCFESIFNIVNYAPPWLTSLEISNVNLSVRVNNVFAKNKINKISKLQDWTLDSLLSLRNFGKTSLKVILSGLKDAVEKGPMVGEDAQTSLEDRDLIYHVRRTLDELPNKQQYILKRRMGFEVSAGTLQEVGDELGVTRERIRQIEAKYVQKIIDIEFWDDVLINKLEVMLDQTHTPLLFFGLSVLDPWFSGIEKHLNAFSYILENFCGNKFFLITVNGHEVISRIGINEWDSLIKEAQSGLQACADSALTKEQCKFRVHSLLPVNGLELKDELWIAASKSAHFATTPEGECIITGIGRGIETVVEAVLTESPNPLHYSKITDIVINKLEKDVDIRRVHNAAANVGFLFGRGEYGLIHHYPLDKEQAEMIVDHALNVMNSGEEGRQWHCAELYESILDLEVDFADKLNPYIINITLEISKQFSYLGRLVWCLNNGQQVTTANRIEVHQAIAAIIDEAGRPLQTNEITNSLYKIRGVVSTFQISPGDLIIRLAPGLWGLAFRDIPWNENELNTLVLALKNELKKRQTGLHYTEIDSALGYCSKFFTNSSDPKTLMYLAAREEDVSTALGGFVYLTEWGNPRRISLSKGIQNILDECGAAGVARSDLPELVKRKTGRIIPGRKITEILSSLGASFDNDSEHWFPSSNDELDY